MGCLFCEDLTQVVETTPQPVPQHSLEIQIYVSSSGEVNRRYYYTEKAGQIIERNNTHIVIKWPSETSQYDYKSPFTVVYKIIKEENEGRYLTIIPLIKWENTRRRK